MATIPTSQHPIPLETLGGRHRVPVPALLLFTVTAAIWAWVCWVGDVVMWVVDWANYLEDRALQPGRIEIAIRNAVSR